MISNANVTAVINAAYNKDFPLSAGKLLELVNSDMSTYELLDVICDFINSMSIIEHKKDVTTLCQMKTKMKELTSKIRSLEKNYNEAMNQLLKTKEEVLSMQAEKGKILIQNSLLTCEKEALKSQIERNKAGMKEKRKVLHLTIIQSGYCYIRTAKKWGI